MNRKKVILILAIVAVALLVWGIFSFKEKSIVSEKVVAPTLIADVYPLYSGVSWNAVMEVAEGTIVGYKISSQTINDLNDISSVSAPFEKYYEEKLIHSGWSVDNALAAGGPGADITVYQKGSQYIQIQFSTNFKGGGKYEPVQCPCDVTFSILSGVKGDGSGE